MILNDLKALDRDILFSLKVALDRVVRIFFNCELINSANKGEEQKQCFAN